MKVGGRRSSAEGAIIEAPKAPRGWGLGKGCLPPQWERGLGRGLCPLPRKFFNFLSWNAAFWVQSDAFSDITRPVPNSLHSQPAES